MDWLANHPEKGQTFDAFRRSSLQRPDSTRKKIYILPLGEFPEDRSPPLDRLRDLTSIFFFLETVGLPAEEIGKLKLTTRKNGYTGQRQILTGDVLNLLKERLPADAYCIVAVTMEDLYPDPDWNFVFGEALLAGRAGVYSFARYDPAFYGKKRGKDYKSLIYRRSAAVLVHEAGHIFGLDHCIYFSCLMNGSNHLEESDSQPLFLCPVCLRKLQHVTGFEATARYRKLLDHYRKNGLEEEAAWIDRRLKKVAGPKGGGEKEGGKKGAAPKAAGGDRSGPGKAERPSGDR